MIPAESPNCTKMLQSSSVLKNPYFDLGSNSGDKDECEGDLMPNFESGIKCTSQRKLFRNEIMDNDNHTSHRSYSYFNMPPRNMEAYDALAKVKQNQASKKIIKKLNFNSGSKEKDNDGSNISQSVGKANNVPVFVESCDKLSDYIKGNGIAEDVEMSQDDNKNSSDDIDQISPEYGVGYFITPKSKLIPYLFILYLRKFGLILVIGPKGRNQPSSTSNSNKDDSSPEMNLISGAKTEPLSKTREARILDEEMPSEIRQHLTSTKKRSRRIANIMPLNSLSGFIGELGEKSIHESSDMHTPKFIWHGPKCEKPRGTPKLIYVDNQSMPSCFKNEHETLYMNESINNDMPYCPSNE